MVLIEGEIGMGKELLAWVVYSFSKCSDCFLVRVNCVVFFEELIFFELFGYEKGVFIGVMVIKIGCFELVDKGIIFLDEIGEIFLKI